MAYDIQIDSGIYHSREKYMTVERWSTYALAISEIMKINPKKILEIGPGNGIVTSILKKIGFEVKTLDFDSSLNPDFVFDVSNDSILDLKQYDFDLILASEVFEHIKYEDFLKSLKNLSQMCQTLVITIPSERLRSCFFGFCLKLPLFGKISHGFKLKYKRRPNIFEGQHYWEIGKTGYPFGKIKSDIKKDY